MIPAVIELRQYTLHPGRRDELITLFEREFVETQEAEGIRLIGQFFDLDDPDRFVWLRGFPDMAARKRSLERFYGSRTWAAHRDAANATMINSDDVLLLKPATPGSGFAEAERSAPGLSEALLLAGVQAVTGAEDPTDLDTKIRLTLQAAGLTPLAVLVTETSENDFPRLPVRADGPFVVWFASASNPLVAGASMAGLEADMPGSNVQRLRLAPTPCSRLSP